MSVKDRIVEVAVEEWKFFGRQILKDNRYLEPRGHRESEPIYSSRVAKYWLEGTGVKNRDGNVETPWSAAFVSWVFRAAGVGSRDFPTSEGHSVYIRQAVGNRRSVNLSSSIVGWRISERQPRPGDVLCFASKEYNPDLNYDNCTDANRSGFRSHGDIVVAIRAGYVLVIGGNVGESVTLSYFKLGQSGFLIDNSRLFFTIVANNLV